MATFRLFLLMTSPPPPPRQKPAALKSCSQTIPLGYPSLLHSSIDPQLARIPVLQRFENPSPPFLQHCPITILGDCNAQRDAASNSLTSHFPPSFSHPVSSVQSQGHTSVLTFATHSALGGVGWSQVVSKREEAEGGETDSSGIEGLGGI